MATLADVADWRALTRAENIPRRPPHAPRPDRGYVDQSPPPTPRPPSVIPLERLLEAQAVSEQDTAPSSMHQPLEAGEQTGGETTMNPEPVGSPPSHEISEEDEWQDFHEQGPSTVGQANLARAMDAADPAHVSPGGKRTFPADYRRRVVDEFVALRQSGNMVSQHDFAARHGLNQTAICVWLKQAGVDMAKLGTAPRRGSLSPEERAAIMGRVFDAVDRRELTIANAAKAEGIKETMMRSLIQTERARRKEAERQRKRRETLARNRGEPAPAESTSTGTLLSRPTPDAPLSVPPPSKGRRRTFNEQERRAMLAEGATLTRAELAARFQLSGSLVGKWRQWYGTDGQKGLRKPRTTTQLPPTSAASKLIAASNGARSFEDLAMELASLKEQASAIALRMGQIKREMMAALADD